MSTKKDVGSPKPPAKHPMQPTEMRERDILRFKPNDIVRHLLDNGPFDMNTIACGDFSPEDRTQFAQLIGYSMSGFSELSYVSDTDYSVVDKMSEGLDERDARIAVLEKRLKRR